MARQLAVTAHESKLPSPKRVPRRSRTGREFAEKSFAGDLKRGEQRRTVLWLVFNPTSLSPQDCVQLNQYKLKDEIGKVSNGRVWGGTGEFRVGGCWTLAFHPVRWQVQPLTAAAQPAPRCNTSLFWVVPIKLYILKKLLFIFPIPPPSHEKGHLKLFFAGGGMPDHTPCYSQCRPPALWGPHGAGFAEEPGAQFGAGVVFFFFLDCS